MSTCPLCRRNDRNLVSSHLLTQQVGRRGRNPNLAKPDPFVVTERGAFRSSKDVQQEFLCGGKDGCEDLLSKRGETYAVGASWRAIGDFPLQEMLLATEPASGDSQDRIYAAASIDGVDVEKLIHYGAGVFWKAAAGSWPSPNPEPVHIDLGPYEEQLRRFVIGEAGFPDAMAMLLFVSPMRAPDQPLPLSAQPRSIHPRKRDCHLHFFIALGLEYRLYVGKRIDDHLKKLCFVRSPEHYILMSMSEEATAREAHDPKRPIAFNRPPRRAWKKVPKE